MFTQNQRLPMCTQNLQYERHVQAMDSQLKLCHSMTSNLYRTKEILSEFIIELSQETFNNIA